MPSPLRHFAFCTLHSAFPTLCLLFLLSSCATPPTPYQQMERDGGYTQQKLTDTTYTISFTGNPDTPYDRVRDFATLRAAEVGKQLNFSWFDIEGTTDKSQRQTIDMPSTTQTTGTVYGGGLGGGIFTGTTTMFPNQATLFRPGVELSVKYYETKPDGRVLDLRNVDETIATLRAKYALDAPPKP